MFRKLSTTGTNIIFGATGSGKSFYGVRDAYYAYKNGSLIFSDTWLNFPHIRYYDVKELKIIIKAIMGYHSRVIVPATSPASYLEYIGVQPTADVPINFYILCDESPLFFSSRDFKTNFSDKELLSFFVQARHFNTTFVAVAQSPFMLDINFRRLAKTWTDLTPLLFGLLKKQNTYDVLDPDKFSKLETPVLYSTTHIHFWNRIKDRKNYTLDGTLYHTKEYISISRPPTAPPMILSLDNIHHSTSKLRTYSLKLQKWFAQYT